MLHRVDDRRIFVIAEALRRGISAEEIHDITKVDIWFIDKINNIVQEEKLLRETPEITKEMMQEAKRMVEIIASDFEQGQILTGQVVSIKEFGAFVEFAPGKEGMVHISKICKERINRVEDVLTLGDKVTVVCLGKDKMGRMSFSIKDVPADAK